MLCTVKNAMRTVGLAFIPLVAHAAPAPIVIGVTAELSTIPGRGIANGATLAAEQINAAGGIDGHPIQLIVEDDHESTTDAIRSFQRMVRDDKAVAVVGTAFTEIALSLEPWAARLHEPYLVTGASSNAISEYVHADYKDRKYIFHAYLPAVYVAQAACDATRDTLVAQGHLKTAVMMSEDAAWTKPLDAGYEACLPKAGVKVLDNIRFALNTTDFAPIYQKIETLHPDMIIAGMSLVGVQATVQWSQQKVPAVLAGTNAGAGSSSFWKETNGATEGVITTTIAAPGVAITPNTLPFSNAYQQKFGITPAYSAYTTFDAIHVIADAIIQAHSSAALPLVNALAATDVIGTQGRIMFQGPDAKFTHALTYGPGYVTGVTIQWQHGQQKCIWPLNLANAKLMLPSR